MRKSITAWVGWIPSLSGDELRRPGGADAGHLMRMNEPDPRLIDSFQTISQMACTAVLLTGCFVHWA
jgi:hypothetical protein